MISVMKHLSTNHGIALHVVSGITKCQCQHTSQKDQDTLINSNKAVRVTVSSVARV